MRITSTTFDSLSLHGSLHVVEVSLHTVSHVTLLVSSGKLMSGSAFFLSPPENKKAKFAFCTLKRKGGSTQKQPFLTVRFRGALLTKSVTLEFSQDTVCLRRSRVQNFCTLVNCCATAKACVHLCKTSSNQEHIHVVSVQSQIEDCF